MPHSFTDAKGKNWVVSINVATIRRVRDLLDVDLLAIVEEKCALLARLADDWIFLVDVLYCVCKPDADAAGMDDVAFGESFSGDCLKGAQEALVGSLIDFFPDDTRRNALRDLRTRMGQVQANLLALAAKTIGEIDPEQATALAVETLKAKGLAQLAPEA